MSAPRETTSAMRNKSNSSMKDGIQSGNSELDVEVQIEQVITVDYSPVMLERTTEGTRDMVLLNGPRDHLENRTGRLLRV